MQLIYENPYRILGLSITATDREIAKRVSNLSVYAEMDKAVNYDYDFVDFAPLERTIETIKDAERKLEQPKDKLLHSLFWISYDDNDNSLKDLKIDNLLGTFNSMPNNNVYSLHNKAIITLFSKNDFHAIQKGIIIFNKFILHNTCNEYEKRIIGKSLSLNYDIGEIFFDELLREIKKKLEPKEIFNLFRDTPKEEHIKSTLTKPIIYKIESEIENAKNSTDLEPENAYKFGEELIENTSDNLNELTLILSENDLILTSISNKLAEQILNCSISYYNEIQEGKYRIFKKILSPDYAYELATKAKNIAKGGMILNRIKDNIKILQEIRFQDCYKAANFLKMIVEAYNQLQIDNKTLNIYERKVLNETMIIKDFREIVTNKIVERTAKSKNEDLISDFNYQINEVIKKMKLTKDFNSIKSIFIEHLPDSNEIKREYNLILFKDLIKQKEIELEKVREKTFYSDELYGLKLEMKGIEQWKLFRTKESKEKQIKEKTKEIVELLSKSEQLKKNKVMQIENEIEQLKIKQKKCLNAGVLQ